MASKNVAHKRTTSCGGVVWRFNDRKLQLLLVKQFPHHDRWGIAKGHVDGDETFEACALREICEETGINVELGLRLPDAVTAHKGDEKTVHSWLCHPTGNDVPTHDDPYSEVADAQWFDVDALPEILMYQRSLVTEAVRVLKVTFSEPKARTTNVPDSNTCVDMQKEAKCSS